MSCADDTFSAVCAYMDTPMDSDEFLSLPSTQPFVEASPNTHGASSSSSSSAAPQDASHAPSSRVLLVTRDLNRRGVIVSGTGAWLSGYVRNALQNPGSPMSVYKNDDEPIPVDLPIVSGVEVGLPAVEKVAEYMERHAQEAEQAPAEPISSSTTSFADVLPNAADAKWVDSISQPLLMDVLVAAQVLDMPVLVKILCAKMAWHIKQSNSETEMLQRLGLPQF